MYWLVVWTAIVTWCEAASKFPDGFQFGTATSAYQVEGGWNASDKSPSIWDVYIHENPSAIADHSTGDVACDSYHLWKEDISLARTLQLNFYRFSISWPRLLPEGFSNNVSEDGTRYYNNLINGLLTVGIEPVVTLYHWDLPQNLQDLGGWTNSKIVDWFVAYSRVAFTLFGDRVKTWVTINEPTSFCNVGYETGILAPGITSPGIGEYLCAKNALLSHAKAYRLYEQEFKDKYKGQVGLTDQHVWYEPKTPFQEQNAQMARELGQLYTFPIFSDIGGWPPNIESIIARNSRAEKFSSSRLPVFTEEEKKLVKGSADFCGVNYYTSRLVEKACHQEQKTFWPLYGSPELDLAFSYNSTWLPRYNWLASYPPGIRRLLKSLTERYGNIEIKIFENGFGTSDASLNDTIRVQYIRDHLEQVLLSITEDGVNVTAYTAWALIDNFEWNSGFKPRFGIVHVDYNDPNLKRTPRASAYYYADVIKKREI
ncbi:myrosinase 1-like [Pieris rapae]|uniref:myrosinase 1-like n=1 Tax=Pieris rapae TaxID=64459 RepID=UPI001E27AD0E|nr:myrosinase 1-like [Pieris rapae]